MALMDIEQNDVNISKLFSYSKKITVNVPGEEDKTMDFYVRLLTDEQKNIAQVEVLRECGELRSHLKDPKWKDRGVYLPNFKGAKKEDVIEYIANTEYGNALLQAVNNIQIPYPAELVEDATDEDREEYQKKIDEYPLLAEQKITEEVLRIINALKIDLNKINKDELERRVEIASINNAVATRKDKLTKKWNAYYGTFFDADFKKPVFKSFEEYKNSPEVLLEVLEDTYNEIDIGGSELKKLLVVTQ